MFVMSLIKVFNNARFLRHAFTSQIKKKQQIIATEQIKTATRSKRITFKVQIHDEISSCNFGLMIQKFREQLNLIVETLVRDMKH
jgi:Cu/Ag efflux protein CusF